MELTSLDEKCQVCSTAMLASEEMNKKWCPKCNIIGIGEVIDWKQKPQ